MDPLILVLKERPYKSPCNRCFRWGEAEVFGAVNPLESLAPRVGCVQNFRGSERGLGKPMKWQSFQRIARLVAASVLSGAPIQGILELEPNWDQSLNLTLGAADRRSI